MRRVLPIALCALLLQGCLASLGLQVGNTGAPSTQPSVGPGGSFNSSSVNARFGQDSAFGTILGIGVLGALFGERPRADLQRDPPALDAARAMHEQDCARALQAPESNLRCR